MTRAFVRDVQAVLFGAAFGAATFATLLATEVLS